LLKSESPGFEKCWRAFVGRRGVLRGFGLALELDGLGVRDVKPRAVQAHVGAQFPGQQRMLFRWIAADEQDGAAAAMSRRLAVFSLSCQIARAKAA
jgi:hypothetical protein